MERHSLFIGITASILAFSCGVAAAQGQSREGRFEVEPLVGYSTFGGVEQSPNYSLQLHDEASLGLRVGYGLADALTVELEYSRTETRLILENAFGFPATDLDDLTIDSILANATFHFTQGRVAPYATVGAGVGHTDSAVQTGFCTRGPCPLSLIPIGPDVPYEETRPMFAAGLGVKAAFSERLGARLDARGYALNQGDTALLQDFASNGEREEWLTSATVSAGLLFTF